MTSTKEIADLLSQAGAAHHVFEQNQLHGVYDKEWPAWYAEWTIQHGLNGLLKTKLDVPTLARLLDEINELHKQSSHRLDWAEFTAEEILKRDV